jgi:K+ transporter
MPINLDGDWGLFPLVLLSTAATVIASQAVISGAFKPGKIRVLPSTATRAPLA